MIFLMDLPLPQHMKHIASGYYYTLVDTYDCGVTKSVSSRCTSFFHFSDFIPRAQLLNGIPLPFLLILLLAMNTVEGPDFRTPFASYLTSLIHVVCCRYKTAL